jgi:hypothetical protein
MTRLFDGTDDSAHPPIAAMGALIARLGNTLRLWLGRLAPT